MGKTKQQQKKIKIACLVLVVALCVVLFTVTYFTDFKQVRDTLAMGDIKITMDETWNAEDGLNMKQGDTMKKIPVVTAQEGDSYLQVEVKIIDKNEGVAENTTVKDPARLKKILETLYYDPTQTLVQEGKPYTTAEIEGLKTNGVLPVANTTDFELNSEKDGVYLYWYKTNNGVFTSGTTVTFLTNVIIPDDWTGKDIALAGKYNIVLQAQAMQTKGFANKEDALKELNRQLQRNKAG